MCGSDSEQTADRNCSIRRLLTRNDRTLFTLDLGRTVEYLSTLEYITICNLADRVVGSIMDVLDVLDVDGNMSQLARG